MRSATARPMGLMERRKAVPPPKRKMIARTPSISIPSASGAPYGAGQGRVSMRNGPGSDQLDVLDRAQRDGDLGVVAPGRTQIHLVGGDVGIHAHRDADDLGLVGRGDADLLFMPPCVAEQRNDVFVGHGRLRREWTFAI